jgi:hypothetical protein
MKQTSIEWLIEQILCEVDNDLDNKKEYVNAFVSGTDLSEYVNKAKEMHKQEIIDAASRTGSAFADKYYEEKFKQPKQ